ncbi:glycoside hydrolase family 43 protein [Punctularia strigosozonata HHB-11173 SS5]|uniref:glycoside hydrolase family 43 protein n=1 Tax=Punctularia strigosozonata (strain HHB-11173) TaxID=741275 RepID=UPI0004416A8D|nr:glycoside hydrolase family 43 protein [Punctularia strigosozonata HHB-11173 SS5]EIN09968.1 glycoside hydrolase family 43 protein [Punctularia strigosozonata HHB-11173 SS5]
MACKQLLQATFALLLFVFCTRALVNPILPGWNPDPTILRVGDDYFIATSTFEQFPGHPIWHSRNLVDWSIIGYGLNRRSQLDLTGVPPSGGSWAPGLRYHKGMFYLVSTTRFVYTPELRLFPRSFYVKTEDIFSNNWSDPVWFDSLGYDNDLFWDTNGDVYNTWSGINNAVQNIYGIWQNRIDLETGSPLTEAQLIFNGTLPLNSTSRPEGPHVYHVNGTYYLMIAEGGSGPQHRSTIQRGPSPSGPWENNPANPILFNGADLSLPVQWTGHADFVEAADGQWWGVALGVRPQQGNFSYLQLGRETFLFPVTWQDGWPIFNHGEPIREHMPGVLHDKPTSSTFNTSFTSKTLDHSFFYHRTPYKPFHSLTARPGYLRINASPYSPGDRDVPALLLRKQASYNESVEVRLDDFAVGDKGSNLTEAGLSAFYDDLLHNDIGVAGPDRASGETGRKIVVRTKVAAQQVGPWALVPANNTMTTTTYIPLRTDSEPVRLKVVTNSTTYTLGYAEGGDDFVFPVTFDAAAMSLPPQGNFFFKGAMWGIYNTGHGRPSLVPADFKYWTQIPE